MRFPDKLGVVSLTCRGSPNNFAKIYNARDHICDENSKFNFVHVSKTWLWAHVQSFSLQFSQEVQFLQYTNCKTIFWESSRNISKTNPGYSVVLINLFARGPLYQRDCVNFVTFSLSNVSKKVAKSCISHVQISVCISHTVNCPYFSSWLNHSGVADDVRTW